MNWNSATLLAGGVVLGLAVGLMLSPVVRSEGTPHVAVWLEVVQRVCTSVGGLGTFGVLIFVVRQFRLLRRQSEMLEKNVVASMDSALYTRLDSFNRFIVEHHDVYGRLSGPFDQNEPMELRPMLHHLCDLGFTFYEEIFKHHVRYKLLETEDWDEWSSNMAYFFEKPYVRGYWKIVSSRFAKSFQAFGDGLCASLPSNPSN